MRRGTTIAVLILLGLAIANGLMFAKLRGDTDQNDARREAVAATREAIPKLFTYSPEDVDHYAARSLPLTTGKFSDELKTMISTQIVPEAREKNTAIRTTVAGSAVVNGSSTEVTVVVFADQWRTDRTSSTPVLNAVRLKVTMRPAHGGWRVAEIHTL